MASGPTPPDPEKLSASQTQSNIATANAQSNLNAINQVTPYGSLTYRVDGYNPDGTANRTATIALSPEQQQLYNTQIATQQAMGQYGQNAAHMFGAQQGQNLYTPKYQQIDAGPNLRTSINNAGPIQTGLGDAGDIQMNLGTNDFSADRQRVEDALFSRLEAQASKDRTSLEQSLANKGIKAGSRAYDASVNNFDRSLMEGRTSAILNAGQEQNRLQSLALNAGNFANSAQAQKFGQNLAGGQFVNAAQAQQYGQNANDANFANSAAQQMYQNQIGATAANNQIEGQYLQNQLTQRNQLLNEAGALTGVGAQMPTFAQTPQSGVGQTDVTGNAWNAYNAQQQQSNNMWNAIGGIGGAVGGWLFSDERLKEDKQRVGETDEGTPIYTYRYKGSPMLQMGVMAQDVKKRQPDAVKKTPSGFLAVNYRRVA